MAERDRVRSGGMSFVPKGVAHAFIVISAEARLITIQSPGAVGQAFYRGASKPALDDALDIVDIPRLQTAAAQNPPRHQAPRATPIRHSSRELSPRHNIHIDIVRDTQTL